jgi:carbohydrate diacid regulator
LAAQTLHIHRHTLAYRLDKITRLTGLNPRQFEDAVQLYAALLLWKMNSVSS